jgi:hypothetical protein
VGSPRRTTITRPGKVECRHRLTACPDRVTRRHGVASEAFEPDRVIVVLRGDPTLGNPAHHRGAHGAAAMDYFDEIALYQRSRDHTQNVTRVVARRIP